MSPISAIFKRGTTPRETAAAATDHADRASDDLSSSNEGKPSGSLDGKSWVSKVPEEELLGAKESLLHQSRKTYGKMRSSYVVSKCCCCAPSTRATQVVAPRQDLWRA